ncbi:MAG TPA: hypothetical protein VJ783_00825 [Pirellulales bacterium]|nr:hypothetical protein [Pirellulales bacterium]
MSNHPRPTPPNGVDGKLVEFDQYIESQIHRTRRQVKGVDLSTSLMLLAVGTLVYLMLVALADHWLVSGGLGFAGRLTAFLVLAAGVTFYVAWRVAPLLVRRINPVYAAHTIERSRPGIKNSLINFLLLRSSPTGLAPRVYEAMEAQAVNALTAVHSDVPVDRKPVIRLLLALMGVVFCLALYAIISPKSPFASFRRVVAPWSDVASPTRVKISDVQPGDATGFHDQHVAVSAEVSGVRSGESVTLYYSTLDGQVIRRPAPMSLPENSYRFTAELPPDSLGLQQNLEYWIEAGDAASPHFQIKVETPPSIVVDELVYEYPKYSELPPQRVAKQGDIQALEGTRVSLAAAANQNIRRADLDFECDGRNDLTMKTDGRRASVAFTLGLDAKTNRPEHETYQLRFTNGDGHENPKPIRYTIDVIRDLPPEVELVEPQLDPTEETPLKAGSPFRLTVRASDPDFKLAAVKLHARRTGLRLLEEKLLAEPRAGEFTRDFILDSRTLALKPGDSIELWASADDNKQPEANHVETPHYTLRITSPDARPQPDQLAKNDRQRQPNDRDQQPRDDQPKQPAERNADDRQQQDQQPGEEGQQGGAQGEQKQNKQQQQGGQNDEAQEGGEGEPSGKKDDARGAKGNNKDTGGDNSREANEGEGQGKQGENAERQGEGGQPSDEQQRVDPNRDPGKAFEKILEHLNKDQQQGDKNQEQPPQDSAGQEQNRDKSNDAEQSGKNAGQDQRSQQEQRPEGKENQTGERQPGDQQSTQEQNGQDQSAAGEKQEDEPGNQVAPSGGKQRQSAGKPKQAGDEQRAKDEGKSVERNLAQKKEKNDDARDGQSPDDQADGQPDEKQAAKPKPKPGKEQTNAGPGDDEGDKAEGEQAQGDMPRPGGKTGKQSSDGDQQQAEKSGERSNAGEQRKPQVGDGKQPNREAEDGDESAKPADGEQEPQKGEGDQASGFGEKDEKSPREHGPDREHKGGDPDSKNKGDGGAGQEGESKRGAASPMNPMQAKEKKQTSDPEKTRPLEDEDPAAASESKKSSDSKGEQSGDQAGGGNASGGQRSNSSGVGSAGQNTASEEGGGQSPEKGKGPTGTRGGDQTKGDEPAEGGKASDEKGAGSHQRDGGDKQGGPDQAPPEGADLRGHSNDEPTQPRDKSSADRENSGQPKQGQSADNDGAQRKQPKSDSQQRPGGQPTPSDKGGNDVQPGKPPSAGRANPTGGGGPPPGSEETPPNAAGDNSEPGGDDPKLEYTRKATDLALEKLQDQVANDKLDPELLEKLKWTPEDMQRFLKQWQQLKHAAEESGPRSDAARELDEALRSLGLRPRGAALEGGRPTGKNVSGLREGQRTAPPPEYREQYREFSKAKAQGLKKSK